MSVFVENGTMQVNWIPYVKKTGNFTLGATRRNKYLAPCIHRPLMRNVDIFECDRLPCHPFIFPFDLNFRYILKTISLIHFNIKFHMIFSSEMTNRHEWIIKLSVVEVLLTSYLPPNHKSAYLAQYLGCHSLPLFDLHWCAIWKYHIISGWSWHCDISWHEAFRHEEFLQWSNSV